MRQAEMMKKIEDFLEKELGAVCEIVIEPDIITAIGGRQRAMSYNVNMKFKVLK